MGQKLSFCGDMVRQSDPDRFLLSLFAPVSVREDLWALFAFHSEIAKTREVVSDTRLGLIRLQWWREALARLYETGEASVHPLLPSLGAAVRRHGLAQADFETLLIAREFDLEDVLPTHMDGLLRYADETSVPLLHMAMTISVGAQEEEAVLRAVARRIALAGILRAVPYCGRQGRCFLPEALLQAAGQNLDALYAGRPVEGLRSVVEAVAREAVPPCVRPKNRFVRAADALAGVYLSQIKALQYDVFHPKMRLAPPFKVLRVLLC